MHGHTHINFRPLKEELVWAIHVDKRLQIISNILLFKTVIPLRNQRIKLFLI